MVLMSSVVSMVHHDSSNAAKKGESGRAGFSLRYCLILS